MRVRISYTVDISDHRRRGINAFYGRPGLATREEIRRWYEANGTAQDLDLDWVDEEDADECD